MQGSYYGPPHERHPCPAGLADMSRAAGVRVRDARGQGYLGFVRG